MQTKYHNNITITWTNMKFCALIFTTETTYEKTTYQTKFHVLNLCFLGEAHALFYLIYLIFSPKLVLRCEAHALLYQTKFYVLNLCFLGEAYALSYLIYLIFFLKLVLRGEAHASPLSNKNLCFEFVFLGWATCGFILLHISSFFPLNLCLEMRHMPHIYKTKFYVLNLYCRGEAHVSSFLSIWIFL